MKKTISILTILSIVLVLTSCKKEVPPGKSTKSFFIEFKDNDIFVAAGATTTTTKKTLKLETLLPTDYKNVKNSELQNALSFIEVSDLPEGAVLKDLAIVSGGNEYKIGTINSNIKLSGNDVLAHLGAIAQDLATKKSVDVQLKFTNDGKEAIAGGVNIKLNFTTIFSW